MRPDYRFEEQNARSVTRPTFSLWFFLILLGGFLHADEMPTDRIVPKGHSARCECRGVHTGWKDPHHGGCRRIRQTLGLRGSKRPSRSRRA